jgi:hypothetical protein
MAMNCTHQLLHHRSGYQSLSLQDPASKGLPRCTELIIRLSYCKPCSNRDLNIVTFIYLKHYSHRLIIDVLLRDAADTPLLSATKTVLYGHTSEMVNNCCHHHLRTIIQYRHCPRYYYHHHQHCIFHYR